MTTSPAPHTHTLPNCLATSAACEDTPPRDVNIPWLSSMPLRSSGEVSVRQSTTLLPLRVSISAFAAVKAILPVAAPGPAGSPCPMTVAAFNALGSNMGTNRESIDSAGIFSSASFWLIRRSFCISTAMRTAASPVRLPFRVCNMNKRPFSIVNSKSCISQK